MFRFGFIYITEGSRPETDHAFVPADTCELQAIGVSSYSEAVKAAKELVAAGADAIELCPGFGFEGVAKIREAVPGVNIAAARFDFHPAMGYKSPDDLF